MSDEEREQTSLEEQVNELRAALDDAVNRIHELENELYAMDVRLGTRLDDLGSKLYSEQRDRETEDYSLERRIHEVRSEAERNSRGW